MDETLLPPSLRDPTSGLSGPPYVLLPGRGETVSFSVFNVLAKRGQLARFYPVFLLGFLLLLAGFSTSLFAQDKTAYLSLKDWGVPTGEHPYIEFTVCNPTQADYSSLDFTEEKLAGPGLTGLTFYL